MKTKTFKRILSTLLVLSIALSLFAVHASAATISESESNNDYASANTLTLGNTVRGKIDSSSDNDYYKITSSSNGKVGLNFKHTYENNSRGWTIYVYVYKDGKYTELTNYTVKMNDGENISLPSIGVATSTVYYVRIVSWGGYGDTVGREYQLVTSFTSTNYYEKEMNNEYATATSVSLGNTYGGNINKSDDQDYFKIAATRNEEIKLSFQHTYDSNSRGWTIYTYVYKDGKYSELSNTTVRMNDGENISLPSIGAAASVVYYVRIASWGGYGDSVGREYIISFGGTSSTTNYTVSYNANGGSVSPSSATVQSGNSVTLPTPTKNFTISYNANGGSNAPSSQSVSISCNGWATSSSATSASYSCGTSYKPTSNTTLYAVWNSSASANLSSSRPSRSGYKFLGWSTNSGATSASYSAGQSVSLSGNVTLYAVWERVNDPEPTPVEPTISGIPGFINWVSSWANSNPFMMIIGYVIVLPLGLLTSPIWVWFAS